MNDIDFLEIGTSNFDTCIQECDDSQIGISVDAVSYYINSLPNKTNVKKLHAAITYERKSDSIKIYYIPEDVLKSNNLCSLLRGCNSIGDYHYQHKRLNITHLVKIEEVPLINIDEFLIQHNIRKIRYLKIDTEGHDCIILNGLFKYLETKTIDYYPDQIVFESNILTPEKVTKNIIEHGLKLGYKHIYTDDENTALVL